MRLVALLCPLLLGFGCGSRSTAPAIAPPTSGLAGEGPVVAASPRHPPCDPITSREPAPPPPDTGAVCGNGVLEDVPGTCVKACAGGCGQPITCKVECTTPREHCDGAAVGFTCESQGYAGGQMGCTSACELDHAGCVACVPGPGTRCGEAGLGGDEIHVVAGKAGAAVFARDATTGRLTGAKVDAALHARPLSRLPGRTLAVGALDGGLGYVDVQRRFGVIDAATGRARTLGPIGGDASRILIARETFQPGGAAVLTGDAARPTLAIFDPPGAVERDQPRHFHLSNIRVVVVPGAHELARGATTGGADLVVVVFGAEAFAYQRDGLALTRLASVPDGLALAFTYPVYTDTIRWSAGQLATTGRTAPDTSAPPPGLGRAALSGATMAAAFGGVLMARRRDDGRRPRAELYWYAGPDPLEPSVTTPRAP